MDHLSYGRSENIHTDDGRSDTGCEPNIRFNSIFKLRTNWCSTKNVKTMPMFQSTQPAEVRQRNEQTNTASRQSLSVGSFPICRKVGQAR